MNDVIVNDDKRGKQKLSIVDGGKKIEQRIRTEPERFAAVLGTRPRARIVIEASTDGEWAPGVLRVSAMRSSSPTRTSRPCMPPGREESRRTGAMPVPWPTPTCSAR